MAVGEIRAAEVTTRLDLENGHSLRLRSRGPGFRVKHMERFGNSAIDRVLDISMLIRCRNILAFSLFLHLLAPKTDQTGLHERLQNLPF